MSQPSNPYGPSRGSGPGARPDAGYPYGAPPPASDPRAAGHWPSGPAARDGSQPIPDPYTVAPVSAEQFRPPRNNRAPWIIAAIVGFVVLLGVGWTVIAIVNSRVDPTSSSSSTPPSLPTQTSNSVDFSVRGAKGNLTFVQTQWESEALHILVRVTVTDGSVDAGAGLFQAFDEASHTLVATTDGAPDPPLFDTTIDEGQQAEGWIVFVTSRQDITVLLFDTTGNVITALVVKG